MFIIILNLNLKVLFITDHNRQIVGSSYYLVTEIYCDHIKLLSLRELHHKNSSWQHTQNGPDRDSVQAFPFPESPDVFGDKSASHLEEKSC